ncbi:uncharacterized protein LOC144333167 [Macaca mulatta]
MAAALPPSSFPPSPRSWGARSRRRARGQVGPREPAERSGGDPVSGAVSEAVGLGGVARRVSRARLSPARRPDGRHFARCPWLGRWRPPRARREKRPGEGGWATRRPTRAPGGLARAASPFHLCPARAPAAEGHGVGRASRPPRVPPTPPEAAARPGPDPRPPRCPPGSGRPGPTSQSPFEIRTGAGRGVAPFVPTQVVRPSGWPETPRWVAQGAALLPRSPGRRWGKPGKTEGGPPDPPRRGAPGEASDLQPFPGRVRAGRAFGNADEPSPGPGLNRLTQPPPAARAAGGGAMSGGLPFSPGAPVHCAFGRSHLSSPHALIRPPPSSPPGSGPEKGRQPGTPRMDNFSFCRRQGQA